MKTKNLFQQKGFEVVYADTDSIFIKRLGCTKQKYEDIAKEISTKTGLPMALDNHYKFLIFLPIESDFSGAMEAQKHYLGILTTGEPLMKGIESRRHDTPELVKVFQRGLIRELFDVESAEEVFSIGIEKATRYVNAFLNEIKSGEASLNQLTVSKVLRKPLSAYTSLLPHVSAAVGLTHQRKTVRAGEKMNFVYVNARHSNPLRRVIPSVLYDDGYYDREKYRDLVIDAAETILSTFGFKRQKVGSVKTLSIKSFCEESAESKVSQMRGEKFQE
jgi:DNA polymerase elongation subunit (family B)